MAVIDSLVIDDVSYDLSGAADSSDLLEDVPDGNNLVDPTTFRGSYYIDPSDGETEITKYPVKTTTTFIDLGNNINPTYTAYFYFNVTDATAFMCGVYCYDENKDYLGFVSAQVASNASSVSMTMETDTRFVKLYVQKSGGYASSNICFSIVQLDGYEAYATTQKIKEEYLPIIEVEGLNYFPVYGKSIVFFGDSIVGNYVSPNDIPYQVQLKTGAECYNAGIGGTSMSYRGTAALMSTLCMYSIADAINSGNWTSILSASSGRTLTRMTYLSELDWTTVDILVLVFGANDSYSALDNQSDTIDITQLGGAMRYTIEKILGAYPHLKLFFASPIDGQQESASQRVPKVEKIKAVCEEYHLPYIDLYYSLGLNSLTFGKYLMADVTHPNSNGVKLIADRIAHDLW